MSSDDPLSRVLARIVDPKASFPIGRGPSDSSFPSDGTPRIKPPPLRIHVTFFVLFFAEFLTSLRYVHHYPMFIVLTVLLYGPILLTTAVIHECGHVCMARWLGGCIDPRDIAGGARGGGSIVLSPLGGFTFCEPPSSSSSAGLHADLRIALAGPLTHIPMGLAWVAVYVVFQGSIAGFSLRTDLQALASGSRGFWSTLCEQGVLLNVFLLWFNIFVPAFPLDGGRIMASSMILLGVDLYKTALLASVASFVVGLALLVWSTASFYTGRIGNIGVFAFLAATFVIASAAHSFLAVKDKKIRQNSLYGRECYYKEPSDDETVQIEVVEEDFED